MSTRIASLVVAIALVGLTGVRAAAAGRLMIYPAAGQSDQQLADDRYACHVRAVQISGFDPSAPPTIPAGPATVAVPDNPKAGATKKGALAGAIAGAVLGGDTRATVQGAVVGAAVGGTVEAQGEAEARHEAQAEADRIAAARAATKADLDRRRAEYRSAIRSCLEERGYAVR